MFPLACSMANTLLLMQEIPGIAGGDKFESFTNRSYKGKTVKAINITDLSMVTATYAKMKGKPVIVSINMSNPMCFLRN